MYRRMDWINFNSSSNIKTSLFKSQRHPTGPGKQINSYRSSFH